MGRKVTFTLDEETIERLQAASDQLRKPKSEVVREAIGAHHDRVGRLSDAEKQRLLRVIRDLAPNIPQRPLSEVNKEIEDVRAARRAGGREGTRRTSR